MHFFNTEKLLLAPFFSLDLCFHFIAPIELCGLPRCLNSKESGSAGDTRDVSSIPGSGRSPGEGNGNPLQYSFLENTMDREAWQATVLGVSRSRTQPSN